MFESNGKRYELAHTDRTQKVINNIKKVYQELQNNCQKRVDVLDDKDNKVIIMRANIESWYCAMDFLPKPSYLPDDVEIPKSTPLSMDNAIFHNKITRFKIEDIVNVTELTTVYELEQITFNQALFILLGFDPNILDYNYWHDANWLMDEMPQYSGARPISYKIFNEFTVSNASIDDCLLKTIECIELINEFNNRKNKIPIQEFLAWAVDKGFLIKLGARILKPAVAEKLHALLTDGGLIIGSFASRWQWQVADILLVYLIVELYDKEGKMPEGNKWDIIKPYIRQKGLTRLSKKEKEVRDNPPNNTATINNIINQLP